MNLNETLDKYFTKEELIDSICTYQLYYQIGLGSLALQSIQDLEATHKKLKELNLQINSQKVFESIYEIVFNLHNTPDFEEKYKTSLKFTALSQMLNDFIKADKELVGSKHFSDMIYEKIKDDTFFTHEVKQQFNIDYKVILPTWKHTITDELANDIKDVVVDTFALK